MTYNSNFYKSLTVYDSERIINKYLDNGTITKTDEQLINSFLTEKISEHIGIHRQTKIASILCLWRLFLDIEYDKIDGIERIQRAINKLDSSEKKYTQNTRRTYIAILKPFLIWLYENNKIQWINDIKRIRDPIEKEEAQERKALFEKKIRAIRIPGKDEHVTQPQDLPTSQEVLGIIGVCQKPLHKAFMSTLYESGSRIEECCSLQWRDLKFDSKGIGADIPDFKTANGTDKRRYSRLTLSVQYLSIYKNQYISKYGDRPEGFVFVGRNGEPLTYAAARQIFDRMITRYKKIELKKAESIKDENEKKLKIQRIKSLNVAPHDFRRSRATHMVSQGYGESFIKESLWANLNTPSFKLYAKIGHEMIDKEFLRAAGVEIPDDGVIDKSNMPHTCVNCHAVNPPENQYCYKCGMALTDTAISDIKAVTEDAKASPEYKDLLTRLEEMQQQILALQSNK